MEKKLTSIKGFLKFKTETALQPRLTVLVKKDYQFRGWWFCHYDKKDNILVEWDLLDSFCEWANVDPKFQESSTVTCCAWSSIDLYPDRKD